MTNFYISENLLSVISQAYENFFGFHENNKIFMN